MRERTSSPGASFARILFSQKALRLEERPGSGENSRDTLHLKHLEPELLHTFEPILMSTPFSPSRTAALSIPASILVTAIQAIAVLGLTSSPALAQSRPDDHAPIGVLGDHTHAKGEWMVSYRYMYMNMTGNRVGTDSVSAADILSPSGYNFTVTPTQMPTQMHMLGGMYGLTDRLTIMGMIRLLSADMTHLTRAGDQFTLNSAGFGDTTLTALYVLAESYTGEGPYHKLHLNFGVSLPSGSITQRDLTPGSQSNRARLAYPMQLGSGTFDVLPGLTYVVSGDDWSGGAQARATVRTADNSAGYRLGNRLMATAWGARKVNDWLSLSVRVNSEVWGNIHGSDPSFASAVATRTVPTVFTNLRGGRRLDVLGGVNILLENTEFQQTRLAFEVGKPVYQNLDGPQLATGMYGTVGIQYTF